MSDNAEKKNTAAELWKRVVTIFRNSLKTEQEVNQWERHFPMFVSVKLTDSSLEIGVTEQMQIEWFTPLYVKPLTEAFHLAGGNESIKVKFVIGEGKVPVYEPPKPVPVQRNINAGVSARSEYTENTSPVPHTPSTMPLHENYTFENFVRGPSNSFAHAAATAVANGPGRTSNNPLFIYGGTGLGKTHLMEAIGHHIIKNTPKTNVCFVTSEVFLNEYINALSNNTIHAFRERYRTIDVLLLDDVQFIAGKANIQEEFFNTFNALLSYKKQVVMTSDVVPSELKIEERLISRFSGGMVVEIESPGYETRLAILKFKSSGYPIPREVLNYIAENIHSHVRAIEGALRKVIMFLEINKDIPLTLEIAQHLLKDSIEQEKSIKNYSVNDIIQTVATFYSVSVSSIKSPERTATLVTPRQVAFLLARKLTMESLERIGKEFNKTHATIHSGIKNILNRIKTEPPLRTNITEIVSSLGRSLNDVLDDKM